LNLLRLSEIGAVIAPPVPAFYADPETIDDLADQPPPSILFLPAQDQ
jgi:4-hydroxy-3-polyprenylbenzoate decarboxylase